MKTVQIDRCRLCDNPAMASTPRGRMCVGHALVETAREWNQGNWSFRATFDGGILRPPAGASNRLTA